MQLVYEFNAEGPVYGPNGELELDPDNDLCDPNGYGYTRPVFANCKNNCPGGKISLISFELFCNNCGKSAENLNTLKSKLFHFQSISQS